MSTLDTDTDPDAAVNAAPPPPVAEITICPFDADVIVTFVPAAMNDLPSTSCVRDPDRPEVKLWTGENVLEPVTVAIWSSFTLKTPDDAFRPLPAVAVTRSAIVSLFVEKSVASIIEMESAATSTEASARLARFRLRVLVSTKIPPFVALTTENCVPVKVMPSPAVYSVEDIVT